MNRNAQHDISRKLKVLNYAKEIGNVVIMGDYNNLVSIISHLYNNRIECEKLSNNAR